MGDMGDAFREMNKVTKEKRRSNLKSSTKVLEESGVTFKSNNGGVHLVVTGRDVKIDFWPSTGKFRTRDGYTGRGVYNMLRHCDVKEENEEGTAKS